MDPFGDPFEEMLGRRRGRAATPKLLVEASPSRTRLRVGEPLVLTYSLDTQTSVADLQFKEAPQFAGFWVEDLERPQGSPSGEAVTVEGESYRRFPILRKLLFPTKAGTLALPAATFRIGLARQGFFDTGGRRGARDEAGDGHRGPAAGRGRLLGGGGPLPRVDQPRPRHRAARRGGDAALPRRGHRQPEMDRPRAGGGRSRGEGLPPQAKSDLRATDAGITGSRTWEFVVVPETGGAVQVPALAFSYFDPSAGRIVTAETAPVALRVEGGTVAAGLPVPPPAARAGGALPLRSTSISAPPPGSRCPAGRWPSPRASPSCCTPASWERAACGGARGAKPFARPRPGRCAPPFATSSARGRRR